MQLVHESAATGETTVLASDVEVADTVVSQALGLMFRRSIPEDYALAFRFRSVASRSVHMLFVPFPIDAVWATDGEVTRVKRLRAWTGLGRASGDLLVELPAGAAGAVESGDTLRLES